MKKHTLLFSTLIGLIAVPYHSQSITWHEVTSNITLSFVSDYMSYGVRLGDFPFLPTLECSIKPSVFLSYPKTDEDYSYY